MTRGRRLCRALAAGMLLAAGAAPSAAAVPRASLESRDGAYLVAGSFRTEAPADKVWAVLTDYEGIGGFVSSISASRVLRRGPGEALIEQEGTGRFLFASRRVKLALEVREEPPSRLSFRLGASAEFARYEGSWRITDGRDCRLVEYELLAEPVPGLGPAFAARRVLRKNVSALLGEVRAEMERRSR